MFNTTLTPIVPARGDKFTLEQLQEAVGGYIELVAAPGAPLTEAREPALVIDEEGQLKGLPVNAVASWLAGREIVGPAVLIYRDQLD